MRCPALLLSFVLFSATLVHRVVGDCECGYASLIDATVNITANAAASVNPAPDVEPINLVAATNFLWTDLLETDFLHLDNIVTDTDWSRQNYSVTAASARGPYGMDFTLDNINLNRISNLTNWSGPGQQGGDPGLQLSVSPGHTPAGTIRCAQMNTIREDMVWGSYRALVKLPSIAGTCSAFFWYFNDSQEIDMELLSKQFSQVNNTFLVNLVHQSPLSAAQGFSTIGKDYQVADLPFDPSSGYHEYRIDYLPTKIIFYGDSQTIGVMNNTVSPQPGHLILTQWSNGDPGWTSGPTLEPAVMSVAYVKAYFNSSNPARQADHSRRCIDSSAPGAVCNILDYPIPTNVSNSTTNILNQTLLSPFFFNQHNMTVNQTVYGSSAVGDASTRAYFWIFALLFLVFFTVPDKPCVVFSACGRCSD